MNKQGSNSPPNPYIEMETLKKQTISEEVKTLLNDSKNERNAILSQLKLGEESYNLGEWITVKNYAQKFGMDVHVIYNWIRRKKIPEDNIVIVEELNGLMLIKAIPYKD